MQTLVECGCGLDVHQATVVACFNCVERRESPETDANVRHDHTRATGFAWMAGCFRRAVPM